MDSQVGLAPLTWLSHDPPFCCHGCAGAGPFSAGMERSVGAQLEAKAESALFPFCGEDEPALP